jgi:hypothetical protein
MKKYTLEQLKTEKIAINVRTKKEAQRLLQKFDETGFKGSYLNVNIMFGKYKNELCFQVYMSSSDVRWCNTDYYKDSGYTIITPDQIDWGENDPLQKAKMELAKWGKTPTAEQDKTPAVFVKAQNDWNGFKAFLKEVEAHGRGLTSSQLKTFIAKVKKDMGEDKK